MGSEAVSELNRLFRYLHNNCIEEIENLSHLKDLDTLNIEHNNITTIEGLSGCARLRTLNLAHNHLESLDDIEHLLECPSVSVLDLSHNKLDDPDILSTLEQMPNLSVLNLMGNDCVREIRNYRKTMTARIPTLKYLDDRPVFEDDRRIAEAWARGGREAETAEREAIKQEKRDKERRNTEAFRRMQEEARAERLQKLQSTGRADAADSESDYSDDDFPETEDDAAPSGDTTTSIGGHSDYFKMHIVEIEDVDVSDDEQDEATGDLSTLPAAESQSITIEDVTEFDPVQAVSELAAAEREEQGAADGGLDDDLDELE